MPPRTPFCLLLLCAATLWPAAVQANPDDAVAEPVRRRLDLGDLAADPAPAGPNLAVPSDLGGGGAGFGEAAAWNVDWGHENATWLPFSDPPLLRHGASPDLLIETILRALPQEVRERGDLSVYLDEDRSLALQGPPADVAAAEALVPWALATLAPRRRVTTELWFGTGADEPLGLRALGEAHLWPGRWTRLYLQKEEVPCTPLWDIEVAEGATISDPRVIPLVEGHELYLRYHPGETVDLVEVWAGNLVHREQLRRDLGAVRNVPEAGGLGVATFMRTAVARTFAPLVLPRAGEAVRELAWEVEGVRLRLVLRAAPGAAPPGARGGVEALRTGALAAALDFEGRSPSGERLIEGWNRLREAEEAAPGTGIEDVALADGGELALVAGSDEARRKAREGLAADERTLLAREARLTWIEAEEPAVRALWLAGRMGLGAGLGRAERTALEEAGALVRARIRLPLMVGGAESGVRLGRCEPGLQDLDVEIAQNCAGYHPVSAAAFSGWNGTLGARRVGEVLKVAVAGTQSWADADAGTLELVLRDPLLRVWSPDPLRTTGEPERRVSLPVLGGAAVPFEREVAVALGGEAEPRLIHFATRERQVLLVLLEVLP